MSKDGPSNHCMLEHDCAHIKLDIHVRDYHMEHADITLISSSICNRIAQI